MRVACDDPSPTGLHGNARRNEKVPDPNGVKLSGKAWRIRE